MADYKYQMIITWSDEDQAFLVDVPDLPGCKAIFFLPGLFVHIH